MTDKEETKLKCLRCDGDMIPGYVLDTTQNGAAIHGTWVIGKPVQRKLLGIKAGLKVTNANTFHINGYRCKKCGRLELFAIEPHVHYR